MRAPLLSWRRRLLTGKALTSELAQVAPVAHLRVAAPFQVVGFLGSVGDPPVGLVEGPSAASCRLAPRAQPHYGRLG